MKHFMALIFAGTGKSQVFVPARRSVTSLREAPPFEESLHILEKVFSCSLILGGGFSIVFEKPGIRCWGLGIIRKGLLRFSYCESM